MTGFPIDTHLAASAQGTIGIEKTKSQTGRGQKIRIKVRAAY